MASQASKKLESPESRGPEPAAVPREVPSKTKQYGSVHAVLLPLIAYARAVYPQFSEMVGQELGTTVHNHLQDLHKRMAPRDPAEEMLVTQLLLTHARVLHLTSISSQQESVESIRTVNEYADRASNTFRRLMLALSEKRREYNPTLPVPAASQTAQPREETRTDDASSTKNTTNEQGCGPTGGHAGVAAANSSLPPDTGGFDLPSFLRSSNASLGPIDRTEVARGQGPIPDERPKAR